MTLSEKLREELEEKDRIVTEDELMRFRGQQCLYYAHREKSGHFYETPEDPTLEELDRDIDDAIAGILHNTKYLSVLNDLSSGKVKFEELDQELQTELQDQPFWSESYGYRLRWMDCIMEIWAGAKSLDVCRRLKLNKLEKSSK